jgi:hypothetical protein
MLKFIFLQFFICISLFCNGQDTILITRRTDYYSKNGALQYMIYSRDTFKFQERLIIYSKSKFALSHCYYFDGRPDCYGQTMELKHDSINVNGINWSFKKEGNKYHVIRSFKGLMESGYVNSLIPFDQQCIFATTTKNGEDTLWTRNYSFYDPYSVEPFLHFDIHNVPVSGKVYNLKTLQDSDLMVRGKTDKIIPPLKKNGESISTIKPAWDGKSFYDNDLCLNPDFYQKPCSDTISFIITKSGKITDIHSKCMGDDSCTIAEYAFQLLKSISDLGEIRPATINGEAVNAKWFVTWEVKKKKDNVGE